MPAHQIARVFPTAACFIVPGETDWRGFLARRPDARLRWPEQKTLGDAAIFLPLDTTPQDVRDCLNEEITQALGPANDLYRLPDSIWNDDNFYGMATPFDMTILRALYQPELHSGMSKAEVAAVLPAHPRPGEPQGPPPAPEAPPAGIQGLGDRDRGRRCRATRRGTSGWRPPSRPPRSPPRCARPTTGSGCRC